MQEGALLEARPSEDPVLTAMLQHVARIRSGQDEKVRPGQPLRFTEAAVNGDSMRQGDLYLVCLDAPLQRDGIDYELVEMVGENIEKMRQLVPGNTEGAKHALRAEDMVGLVMHRPKVWNADIFVGPHIMHPTKALTVTHPVHGDVIVPAGMGIQCLYQTEFDRVTRLERRAQD